jgi:hypothetical protein
MFHLAGATVMAVIAELQLVLLMRANHIQKTYVWIYAPLMLLVPGVLLGFVFAMVRRFAKSGEVSPSAEAAILRELGSAIAFTYLAFSTVIGVAS